MSLHSRSSSTRRISRLLSRQRLERFVALFFRVAVVALFFGMGGYWAAAALGEFLSTEEMQSTRSLLGVPLSRSLLPEASERPLTLKEFVGGDPFLVYVPPKPKDESRQITAKELFDLEGIRLTGTLPGISVWIQEAKKPQAVVLKGQKIKGYDLTAVEEDRIILQKGPTTLTVLLRYSAETAASAKKTAPAVTAPREAPQQTLSAARPGQQGSISRETVNQLLMDPLAEMKKFRLRPKFDGDTAAGIEVQWLDDQSILTSLGVKAGDVVQTVNGVPIRNMGDVVNVINSLMSGNTFDVQVVREGKPEMLNYNIK